MSRRKFLSTFATLVLPIVAIVLIGCLSYRVGFGFNLFPLYLIPLAIVAWKRSLPVTVFYSVLAGTAIILKISLTEHFYANSFLWYWDGLVKFSILMIFACGLWRIRQLQLLQEKQNISKIMDLNASLEDQVEQLTAANKELAEISYTISHDLRAPLRHVIGFAEMLNEQNLTSLDQKSRHYLEVITHSAHKMADLVDGLLVFSQLGRTELVKTRIDLDQMVGDVVKELAREAKGREIEWNKAPLPAVVGDANLLRLVIFNLIANAVKFTQTRSLAKIEIGALDEADEIIIYVRDNGAGFDGSYVNKLFGIFQRLHGAEEFEGAGVGLASVQRIIVRHGGRVWAEGAVDVGATFWFSLPKVP